MEEVKQEEIKKEEVKVEAPNYENLFKEINDKLDNLTKENGILKNEIINLKNLPKVEEPPKKIERSFKFIKEIF